MASPSPPAWRPRFALWNRRWALRVAAAYATVGVLWILASDWAAERLFGAAGAGVPVQTVKGLLFVLGTAAIFYTILRRAARRLAAADARISEAAWFEQAVFEHLPGFVYRCRNDASWTMEFVSGGARTLTGYRPEDLVGNRRIAYADLIHPEDREAVADAVSAALARGEIYQMTYRLVGADGAVRWVWEQGRASGDTESAVLEGVVLDVSEWKTLEDQLRQAQKLEAVGQLTGGIAHDFNNVLSVILANTELAAAAAAEPTVDRDEVDGAVTEIRDAAESAASLVRRLAGFSRQLPLQLAATDLRDVVADAGDMLRRLLPESIRVELPAAGPSMVARVDRHAVEQILLNLGTNSRDAMPQGGRLTLELAAGPPADAPTAAGGSDAHHRVTVRDTGHGMDAATAERVFEPFFTTKPLGEGTGLGLAMVYGLMRAQNGFVQVDSRPGGGTAMHLYFPPVHPAASADDGAPPPRESPPRGRGEVVLVVEDDERLRATAMRVLGRLGYRVLEAADGREALDIIAVQGAAVDVVFSDLVMPHLDGLDLLEALRARDWPGRFLMTSGYSAADRRDRLARESDLVFLQKPWALTDLAVALRRVLDPPAQEEEAAP